MLSGGVSEVSASPEVSGYFHYPDLSMHPARVDDDEDNVDSIPMSMNMAGERDDEGRIFFSYHLDI